MIIRVVGIGMGLSHLTPQAVAALEASAYVVAAAKRDEDPLLAVRREVCEVHGLDLVAVPDPERDRHDVARTGDYRRAVRDWHTARADAWAAEIEVRAGDPALLVWGDPSLYDSAVRVAWSVADRLDASVEVVAGVSAPSVLAAAHRIVLHAVGQPVHLTTERRLVEDIGSGQRNLVVMLTSGRSLDHPGLQIDGWSIWWGANLGTTSQELVAGRVGDVGAQIDAARERARSAAGWVMDTFLLRGPAAGPGVGPR